MASTYVNDLRLNEMATGDQSGSWGTVTNTNLELIGDALGYGTEAPFNTDANKTTTVLDGAYDPARAMYFKVTSTVAGGLTATRQLTIDPDTISRLMFIENATTGGESITIKQGSGAGAAVTIPNGHTKAVILPGDGSGSIVLDAFAALSVVDLLVDDDLTVTDDVAIGGLATVGGTLGVTGIATFTDDIIIGDGKTIGSASDVDAMTIAANGQVTFTQTLIGTALDISGDIDVDGTTNLDIVDIDGAVDMASTLQVDGGITTNGNISVVQTTPTITLTDTDQNTDSLIFSDGGTGKGSLYLSADHNDERDDTTLNLRVDGDDVVIVGYDTTTLNRGVFAVPDGSVSSPSITNTGDGNTGMYFPADETIGFTSGGVASFNLNNQGNIVYVGSMQLQSDAQTGSLIMAGGNNSNDGANIGLHGPSHASLANITRFRQDTVESMRIDASGNIIIANSGGTLYTTTAGISNFRAGVNAGNSIASGGNYNVCIGDEAGTTISTGDLNTFVGYSAGTAVTGTKNVAVGADAMLTSSSGDNNIAVGREALKRLTTSNENVAVGSESLKETTTGTQNVAMGHTAGQYALTADSSTFVGHGAGKGITGAKLTGDGNTAIGKDAGLLLQGAAADNTLVGIKSGDSIATAVRNVIIGSNAATSCDSNENVIIGFQAGTYSTAFTTGIRNCLVGAYTNTDAVDSDYANGFGYFIEAEAGYTTVGQATSDIRAAHGNVTWATVSDERYKKDIVDSTAGLSFINALQPRTFKYKALGELPETFRAYEADSTDAFKNSNTNHGFIAQEVKAAIDADSSIKDGFNLWDSRPDGSQEVAEAALIPILVKAIQELTARIAVLEG